MSRDDEVTFRDFAFLEGEYVEFVYLSKDGEKYVKGFVKFTKDKFKVTDEKGAVIAMMYLEDIKYMCEIDFEFDKPES